MWIRKFIKRIDYSKEEIALLLYYKGISGEAPKISTNETVKETTGRNLKLDNTELSPEAFDFGSENDKWLRNMNFNQTISIILPNTIHACKKKGI